MISENWIEELKQEADYVEEEDNIVTISKAQYLDNGYGNWFTSDIVTVYNEETGEVEKVSIDGDTAEDLEKMMDELMKECECQKRFDECAESLELEEHEELLSTLKCGDCETIIMKSTYLESLNW